MSSRESVLCEKRSFYLTTEESGCRRVHGVYCFKLIIELIYVLFLKSLRYLWLRFLLKFLLLFLNLFVCLFLLLLLLYLLRKFLKLLNLLELLLLNNWRWRRWWWRCGRRRCCGCRCLVEPLFRLNWCSLGDWCCL